MDGAQIQQDELNTGTDLVFENRFWKFQTSAWILLACLIVAGLLGLFGRGVFSSSNIQTRGGRIEFERMVRYKTPSSYQLDLIAVGAAPDAAASRDVRVLIGADLLAKLRFKIAESVPPPSSVEPHGEGIVLVYTPGIGSENFKVDLAFEPKTIGPVVGNLGVSGSAPIEIRQFVLP
jgi:hypothetical protein